jgi:hypothetical protein
MKTLHILSASLILAAASSAFAGTDDGNVPGAYILQTPRQVTTPVATKDANSKDTGTAASAKKAETDFLRQQTSVSGN